MFIRIDTYIDIFNLQKIRKLRNVTFLHFVSYCQDRAKTETDPHCGQQIFVNLQYNNIAESNVCKSLFKIPARLIPN